MFRKTIAVGPSKVLPQLYVATESYYFLAVLVYRRDVLVHV